MNSRAPIYEIGYTYKNQIVFGPLEIAVFAKYILSNKSLQNSKLTFQAKPPIVDFWTNKYNIMGSSIRFS